LSTRCRTHTHTLDTCLPTYLSICLYTYNLSIYLSTYNLSRYLSIHIHTIYLSIYLYTYNPSSYLFRYIQSIYLSYIHTIYLSIYICIYIQSIYASIHPHAYKLSIDSAHMTSDVTSSCPLPACKSLMFSLLYLSLVLI